jgi:hypothetical protein
MSRRMKMRAVTVCLFALAFVCLVGSVQADLITNGNFEATPNHLAGWTTVSGNVGTGDGDHGSSGNWDLALKHQVGNEAWAVQAIGTASVGQVYHVQWDGAGLGSSPAGWAGLAELDGTTWNMMTPDSGYNSHTYSNGTWETRTLDYTIKTGDPSVNESVGMMFGTLGNSSNEGAWIGFDNVSATVVTPEPGAFILLGTGLIALVCYAWRKRK